jgi:hypothetical protein
MKSVTVVGTIILGLSLIPLPYRACQSWDVSVVDDIGCPVKGETVRLVYQNYSTEARSHEEDHHRRSRVTRVSPTGILGFGVAALLTRPRLL